MKINCLKTDLVQTIQVLLKAINNKPEKEYLSGIHCETVHNQLIMKATNENISIICHIEADIIETGKILLPAKYFYDMTRILPNDNIQITTNTDNNLVNISSGTATFNLVSMPIEHYPVLEKMPAVNQFKIRNNILLDLIDKTSFASAKNGNRPVFTGCLLDIQQARISMVGTNMHRLAVKHEVLDNLENPNLQLIIPATLLDDLSTLLVSDIPSDVFINYSNNQISFSYENIYIQSRLIEGTFPNYQNVIPKTFMTEVNVKKDELKKAIERVALISRSNEYNTVSLFFSDNILTLTSVNLTVGKAEEHINVKITGPEVKISFNVDYLVDVLKHIEAEDIVLSLNSSLQPITVKPLQDDSFIYVVTPMRTNN